MHNIDSESPASGDAGYNGKDKVQEIAFLGEDYFNLLRNNKESSRMLALGRNVTFKCNGNWYRVN